MGHARFDMPADAEFMPISLRLCAVPWSYDLRTSRQDLRLGLRAVPMIDDCQRTASRTTRQVVPCASTNGLALFRAPERALWLRLGLPISLIIALAIGFVSFLNFYNYGKTYRELNVARLAVMARDVRQAIESGLNVGLAPRSTPSSQARLQPPKSKSTACASPS